MTGKEKYWWCATIKLSVFEETCYRSMEWGSGWNEKLSPGKNGKNSNQDILLSCALRVIKKLSDVIDEPLAIILRKSCRTRNPWGPEKGKSCVHPYFFLMILLYIGQLKIHSRINQSPQIKNYIFLKNHGNIFNLI